MSETDHMRSAIEKARTGIDLGQAPFGALIVRGGKILAAAHNTVWRDSDPTAHAEMNAIRQAATTLGGISLAGCTMYTTCEPCPMCLAAIHWSKIDRVSFGASIADAAAAGFSELSVNAEVLAKMGGSPLKVESGMLRRECRALFALWKESPSRKAY
jgi:guanine deaminase